MPDARCAKLTVAVEFPDFRVINRQYALGDRGAIIRLRWDGDLIAGSSVAIRRSYYNAVALSSKSVEDVVSRNQTLHIHVTIRL